MGLGILCSCKIVKLNTQSSPKFPDFDIEAHRGGRGLYPENTIIAMKNAIDLGVNTLEMDAVISKDKQVVLSQEPYFNNEISLLPNGKSISLKDQKTYNIYKMDYNEVKKFDVGSKVHNRFPGQVKFKTYNIFYIYSQEGSIQCK